MLRVHDASSRVEHYALESAETPVEDGEEYSSSHALLNDALQLFAENISHRTRISLTERHPSGFSPKTSHDLDAQDKQHSAGDVPGLFRSQQREVELRRITPQELRQIKAEHECNRSQLIFELSRNISKSQLKDTDKAYLRRIQRSLVEGNLDSFDNTLRELPDVPRAYLISAAAKNLKPLGIDLFQLRATSLANGANVGDHDFIVLVRHGDTIVETHSDLRVPSATYQSPFANYIPRIAVSDRMPLPQLGTTEYSKREFNARSAFAQLADKAVMQFANSPTTK